MIEMRVGCDHRRRGGHLNWIPELRWLEVEMSLMNLRFPEPTQGAIGIESWTYGEEKLGDA